MEAAERAALAEQLRLSCDEFCGAVSGLTDAQASFRPAPDRWSIADCVEHVAVVEKGFFRWLSTAYKTDVPLPAPTAELEFRKRMTDRGVRMQSPDPARPTGRYGSLAASLERFRAAREETIAYAGTCPDDLHTRTVTHLIFGVLSCHQGVLFLVGHVLRHAEQIREIKASPRYPA